MRWGPGGDLENRSSSESGYGTSVGDTRGDASHQDMELDEVFYLEQQEEEEEEEEVLPFTADKSHICVGLYSGQVQYKH